MALEHLEGSVYGPVRASIAAAKVAEYVVATGDDRERWTRAAPPSYAGSVALRGGPAVPLV